MLSGSQGQLHRSTRDGHPIQVQQQHLTARRIDHKDAVVRAIAWDDGSADFVFGDGTVLSFCDDMNSFVAFTPTGATDEKRVGHNASPRCQETRIHVESEREPLLGSSLYKRDMMFTAWTISQYTRKVRDALGLYNYYSPKPRLIDGLVSTPVKQWRQQSSMDALILVHHPRFLDRRAVTVTVPVQRMGGVTAASSAARRALADRTNLESPLKQQHQLLHGLESSASSGGTALRTVELGVEATLWCALRQTSLTLHANGTTFSVRWPAPVTQPNKTRTPCLPKELLDNVNPSVAGTSYASLFADLKGLSVREALRKTQPYTYITQTFLVAAPPPAWADMLRVAQQLHEETPSSECFRSPSEEENQRDRESADSLPHKVSEGALYLTLPTVAEPTTRQNACSFSKMQVSDAHALIAGGSLSESARRNAALHPTGTELLWLYHADPTGREAEALYWNLNAAVAAVTSSPSVENANREKGTIVALVREDASILTVSPSAQGYSVQHQRSDGSAKVYHVSADGDVALPPSIGPLVLPAHRVQRSAASWLEDEADEKANEACAYTVQCEDLATAQQLTLLETVGRAGVEISTSPFYTGSSDLTDSPRLSYALDTQPLFGSLSSTSSPSRWTSAGRYLPRVGDIAIQVSQCSLAAAREGRALTVSAPLHSLADTGDTLGHRRRHPLMSTEDATIADATDASLFRATGPISTSAADGPHHGQVVFLSTRLDGVGNFTALTNGVIRCHFDDRTLLTLIPGANLFEEEALVADCLFRDATRCVARVARCTPSHVMFRYISFSLPFRRYALMRAAQRGVVGDNNGNSVLMCGDSSVFCEERVSGQVFSCSVQRDASADADASNSVTTFDQRERVHRVASPSPMPNNDHHYHPQTTSNEAEGSHLRQPPFTTLSSLSASPIRPMDRDSLANATFPDFTDPDVAASRATHTHTAPSPAAFGLQVASWADTVREREMEHELALRTHSERISQLLALNESLSAKNRSLLSEP